MRQPNTVKDVVEAGLCIGCGLCEALAPLRWKMTYTPEGRLRPAQIGEGSDAEIMRACPGAIARPNSERTPQIDPVWGGYYRMQEAWAGDPEIRFRAATGGVLTALASHLLRSGEARFILHCAADPEAPMRSSWCLSVTPEQVLERAGSRYGPSDTLAGLQIAIDRNEPFAVVAKPCDAGAVRAHAKSDHRLARNLVAVLVMVCGGASDLGKSKAVLEEYGLSEGELRLFRYRGYGNPGATRIETEDGRVFQKSYNEMWDDESGWRIQTRCKLCPDALGEAADISAADIWPGGSPDGEDEGFNGVITRTSAGDRLFHSACVAGSLKTGKDLVPRQMDGYQPHQIQKKHALLARLRGMMAAGSPTYAHEDLRLDVLDTHDLQEEAGALQRVSQGKFREKLL